MSCPHPSAPVERVVGSRVDLVCRDCHARFEPAPVIEDVDPMEDYDLDELDSDPVED